MSSNSYINDLWRRISRNGLYDHESVIEYRSIIFLNRILSLAPVVMLFYVPIEVFYNGWELVPMSLLLSGIFALPLVLIRYRRFWVAKISVFLLTQVFVFFAGLFVGKSAGNFITFIPIVLMGVLLFNQNWIRLLSFILVVSVFLLQDYCFALVEPSVAVSEENKKIFSTIFMVMGMLMNFMIGYYLIGVNDEYESVISGQKALLEMKNQEITDSVNYAQRIQEAYLPDPPVFSKLFPESFLLFKPKDIVSGDFYWVYGVKNGDEYLVFAAVADCTGHGIPGALLTIICCNALNEVVVSGKEYDPGRILDKTRDIILTNLKSHQDGGRNDGMDISLVALASRPVEPDNYLALQWAGANNPLWIIRNGNGGVAELVEVRPDKQPVGKFVNPTPFTTHQIEVNSGDTIYLFSDGFQDQFGGSKGKKFKAANLKSLLLSIQHMPMREQHETLLARFDSWKGEIEQLDDVCMIGLKI